MREFIQAIEITNLALQNLPEDIDFIYARGLLYNMLDKNKLAEKDFIQLLKLAPDHANALNALGYTLANQPHRTKEAFKYLSKAMELIPNNPAFMDSMGWLLYKTGYNQDAIDMLKNAYEISQDSEIAVHFGEVLWESGHHEHAKKIFTQAIQNDPEHTALQETIQRLNIQLPKINPHIKMTGQMNKKKAF